MQDINGFIYPREEKEDEKNGAVRRDDKVVLKTKEKDLLDLYKPEEAKAFKARVKEAGGGMTFSFPPLIFIKSDSISQAYFSAFAQFDTPHA
ncbi:hypothetical protein V2J23_01785 [Geobacillus thermoleovorans]|uniref:hypothetical protein n=1 Tax=Geobacillus thermoleovorans TaxID=33941 RepID=UPI00345C12C7